MARSAESLPVEATDFDQCVYFHEVSWPQFESMLALRGDHGSVRFTYLEGELELMSPSSYHELTKTKLARLIEAFAEERGIALEGFGSWTIKSEQRKRGVEPDECYVVGPIRDDVQRPHFAIEVVHTSGGVSKLSVYQGLEVPEVWFFRQGRLELRRLEPSGYVATTRSAFLPNLDPALIARCMQAENQTEAVRQLKAAMREPA